MWLIYIIMSSCDVIQNDRWNGFLNFVENRPQLNFSYAVHVTFENQSPYDVDLYRVRTMSKQLNPLGLVEAKLVPGEEKKISCDCGDTFTIKINSPGHKYDQMLLMSHDVSRVYIHDHQCLQEKLIVCDRKPFTADNRWTPPDSFMLSNTHENTVDLYYWDGICEEKVGTVLPNENHHLQSTIGHVIRVRDSEKLIQEHTLEKIIIQAFQNDDDYEFSEKATKLFNLIHLNTLKESVIEHEKLINELSTYSNKVCN